MKYIQFTHVDAVTGISVESEPAANGPKFPNVAGLAFQWARESAYPTSVPSFFGTCPDDSFVMVDGVVQVLAQSDYEQMWADEIARRPTLRDIAKIERTKAVAAIKVIISTGKIFDGDEVSQTRMARAIIGLQAVGLPSITWVLADNTETDATLAELTEAMILAGQAQSAVWVI